MKPPAYADSAARPTSCGRDRVCCDRHTARWMPVPETDDERRQVAAALERWDGEFWLVDPYRAVPDYVAALWPAGTVETWPAETETEAGDNG